MPTIGILPSTLSIPKLTTHHHPLSFLQTLTQNNFPIFLPLHQKPRILPPIRMGGGPRTFPGGVTKWQWKRMQAKKSKQLLKARLLRERQIYEMRKRAELKAAVSELEKPWEIIERAPTLFSVKADEQVKALADRFQKPGGFDMWGERDGPQMFGRVDKELPSSRFFPKGVVHSVKPYGVVGEGEEEVFDDWVARGGGGVSRRRRRRKRNVGAENSQLETECNDENGNGREAVKSHSDSEGNRYSGFGKEITLRPTTQLYSKERDERRGFKGNGDGKEFKRDGRKGFSLDSNEKRESLELGGENSRLWSESLEVLKNYNHGGGGRDGRKGFRSNSYEKRNATFSGSETKGNGNDRRNDRFKMEKKITLRPTTDLYPREGDGRGDAKSNSDGNGLSRRNYRRSV